MDKLLYTGKDWNWDKLNRVYDACEKIATEELKLDYYPNILEIIRSDQMIEAYSSNGLPQTYDHWSFGKSYAKNYNQYHKGQMGLAYEIVINTSPTINYLMEENTMTCQSLVIAHAAFGHNSFFKNNYLFKQWTCADSIVDYMVFARKFIKKMEERYGEEEVEHVLDLAHSLQQNSIDRYPRPKKKSLKEEIALERERFSHYEKSQDQIWSLIDKKVKPKQHRDFFLPDGPEENLLYFLEKKSPVLKAWQREILRIVRKISQYFRPQMGTQVANEGWASTVHYYIMNRLWETGQIDNGAAMEFLDLHTAVVRQLDFDHQHFSGFNPYHLGFNIFSEIKRISQNPTQEDKDWFPDFAGGDWVENWHHAFTNFRDDSLIQQFMTPKLMREMKLFILDSKQIADKYNIANVSNESGYKRIRNQLADNYNVMKLIPDIQVTHVDFDSRMCHLTHYTDDHVLLDDASALAVLDNFNELWGFPCSITTCDRTTGDVLKVIPEPKPIEVKS